MSVAHTASSPRPSSVWRGVARLFNRLVLVLAGTRLLPLYGVLEHRGRRSGKAYRTPIVVRSISDGFIVPMPWGEGTDWCRNVRAASECVIRWKGGEYPMVQPEVIDVATARAAFGATQQSMMNRFAITHCVRLHHRS